MARAIRLESFNSLVMSNQDQVLHRVTKEEYQVFKQYIAEIQKITDECDALMMRYELIEEGVKSGEREAINERDRIFAKHKRLSEAIQFYVYKMTDKMNIARPRKSPTNFIKVNDLLLPINSELVKKHLILLGQEDSYFKSMMTPIHYAMLFCGLERGLIFAECEMAKIKERYHRAITGDPEMIDQHTRDAYSKFTSKQKEISEILRGANEVRKMDRALSSNDN